MISIPQLCSSLLINSDFGYRVYIDIEIYSVGMGRSSYFLIAEKYISYSIYQELNTYYIMQDQEFLISAKFRLLNAMDLVSGVDCEPNIKDKGSTNSYSTVAIYGSNCSRDNKQFYFYNEISSR